MADRQVSTDITTLARELGELGIWVRMHYLYPYPHVDNLLPLMAEGRILPYIDAPLQHADPAILKAMRRPANAENSLKRIKGWREICPEVAIRSTFIVGFPGETEQCFEQLMEFLYEAELDRVGCFTYSPVEGASANGLPGAVPEEVANERHAILMQAQAEISARRLSNRVGNSEQLIVDEIVEQDNFIARSYADAPEVDGKVFLDFKEGIREGDLIEAQIIGSDVFDLIATTDFEE